MKLYTSQIVKFFIYSFLFTIIFLFTACNNGQTTGNSEVFLSGKAQTSNSRIFADKIGNPNEFASLDTLQLFRPYLFDVSNSKVVINNSGTGEAKFLVASTENPSNNYIFGSYGKGPGEYLNPIDVEISNDGSIYVIDSPLRRLDKWSQSGELIESKLFDSYAPYRMTFIENSNELYIFTPSEDRLFHRYDSNYNHLSSFQTASDSLNAGFFLKNVYLSGELDSDHNHIYYAGYGNHFLKKYSTEGKLLFSRVMIEKIAPPSLVSETVDNGNGEMLKKSDDFKAAAQTIVLYQNKIFVLYLGNDFDLIGRTIDVYDSDTGDYIYSLKISSKYRRAHSFAIDSQSVIYSLEYDANMNYKLFTYNLRIQ